MCYAIRMCAMPAQSTRAHNEANRNPFCSLPCRGDVWLGCFWVLFLVHRVSTCTGWDSTTFLPALTGCGAGNSSSPATRLNHAETERQLRTNCAIGGKWERFNVAAFRRGVEIMEIAWKDKFYMAFRLCPFIMTIHSFPDMTVIDVNEAYERKTGLRRD